MSRSIQQATCVPNLKNLSWFMRPWLQKCVWPTFGCKLGQSDPIVMQLKPDMSCHLLKVYAKFQIDISKHVEEKSGKRGQTDGRLYCTFDISIRWSWMHRILLRHTYVVIFLQLFSLIGSFHLIQLIVFNIQLIFNNTFDLPFISQHRNRSSNNTVDFQ